jgi:hemoglobin-like flavoprotein
MSTQTEKFINTLRVVVEGLRQQDILIPAIQSLGRRHVDYKVEDSYYTVAGEALIWTLQKELGQDFTPPVQKAWEKAYEFVSTIMIDAAKDARDAQKIGL